MASQTTIASADAYISMINQLITTITDYMAFSGQNKSNSSRDNASSEAYRREQMLLSRVDKCLVSTKKMFSTYEQYFSKLAEVESGKIDIDYFALYLFSLKQKEDGNFLLENYKRRIQTFIGHLGAAYSTKKKISSVLNEIKVQSISFLNELKEQQNLEDMISDTMS